MITAGIDAGALTTKAVIMEAGRVLARFEVHSSTAGAAAKALEEALKLAGLRPEDVKRIIATGIGKKEAPAPAAPATEVVSDARGARHFFPSAGTVIDIGAESSRVVRCDPSGRVQDFALNDKCAAGTGVFLDAMAKALRVPVDKMGEMSLQSTQDIPITSTCVVFAESEVVSQIHRQVPARDILSGLNKSIATRVFGMANRVGVGGDIVVGGGLARNIGLLKWLREMLGADLHVPEAPQFLGAVGAALLAEERNGQ